MFTIDSKDNATNARGGTLKTAHGEVKTPLFMPVASHGVVKTLSSWELEEIGVQAIIANSFLLYLKPGLDVIENAGGLHKFMNWPKTIFTDSGGFQFIRREYLQKLDDKGCLLKGIVRIFGEDAIEIGFWKDDTGGFAMIPPTFSLDKISLVSFSMLWNGGRYIYKEDEAPKIVTSFTEEDYSTFKQLYSHSLAMLTIVVGAVNYLDV